MELNGLGNLARLCLTVNTIVNWIIKMSEVLHFMNWASFRELSGTTLSVVVFTLLHNYLRNLVSRRCKETVSPVEESLMTGKSASLLPKQLEAQAAIPGHVLPNVGHLTPVPGVNGR